MLLTDISLKRPVFTTVTILALIVLGIISYFRLSINDWPNIEYTYITVTIVQPGAAPEQLESKVAQQVEEAVGEIAGIRHIYTKIQEGVVTVTAEFTLETEAGEASQEVKNKISAIRGELPEGIEEPVISKWDPLASPIVSLVVTGENQSLRELTTLVDDVVKKRLQTIDGIGGITVNGAEEREIQINLDKDNMAAYGLTTTEVLESIGNSNLEAPVGNVNEGNQQTTLTTSASVDKVEGFNILPVGERDGIPIYVRDIAAVVDGIKEKQSLVFYQGKPAIGLDIVKQSGSNTVKVADQINKGVAELRKSLPKGVQLTVVRDNSVSIRNSVNDVAKTLVEGAILAVLTVLLFLKNWRTTLVSAVSIPTSIIATFFAIKLMGFTLNTMTLMALSLSVGLLIDDAIVVIENITRHLQMGKSPWEAARDGTSEIGLAVMATTLTIVAVFLPVGMMTGEVGQFFKQFGLTVVFSVLVSLLVSLTLVPLMASRYLHDEEQLPIGIVGRFIDWFNKQFDRLALLYVRCLKVVLVHRWKTVVLSLALFVGSLALVPFLPSNFVSSPDLDEFSVVAELDSGLSLAAAREVTDKMEELIRNSPDVRKVYSTTTAEKSYIYVKTTNKNERNKTIFQIAADMRSKLSNLPGVQVTVYIKNFAGLEEKTFVYSLLGEDLEKIRPYAEKTQQIMEEIPGTVDVTSSYKPGKPEAELGVIRDAASDLGVSPGNIAATLNTLFSGTIVSQYEEGEDRVDVRVGLGEAQRKNLEDLDNIYLPGAIDPASGISPMIALSQVARPQFNTASSEISRFDRSQEIQLSGNLDGISLGEFNNEFARRFQQEITLPDGCRLYAGGDAERMENTFTDMILTLLTAIFFIFFILAAQFESFIDPLSIMLSLPLAMVGAVLALLVMGSDLSMISAIGIIMLMGLVTKNAILLIDFTKKARAQGIKRNAALQQAASIRLRPILMTSLAMIFGMMPLAFGMGDGAEVRAPMAHAIIGGLVTSTLLTLLVVPVVYTLLDDLKVYFGKQANEVGSNIV